MSINRFEEIQRNINFNDNMAALPKDHPDHDRLYK